MTVPRKKAYAELRADEIPDKVAVEVYELNMLLKLAASHGLFLHVDIVDRGEAPEVKIDCR